MKRQSQENFVKEYLFNNECITRNYALSCSITRLGAIMHKLKKQGIAYTSNYIYVNNKKDFIYVLKEFQHDKLKEIINK